MYFWNINKLKSTLKEGQLSELSSMIYLFPFLIAYGFTSAIPREFDGIWDIISSILDFSTLILGAIYCFWQNGASRGSNFLQKYFSIGFVVMFRMAIIFILPSIALFFVILFLTHNISKSFSWYETLYFFFIDVIFYWRMGVHLKDVANSNNSFNGSLVAANHIPPQNNSLSQ